MKFGNETLYRLFVLVADEKSITKASEKLYISQPAVSKQIKKIESELNTILFNRKNMELTKNGKKLYNELKPIFSELERIEHSFETKRKIRLGTYNTLMSKLLSSSILEYYKKNKDNDVIIENSNIEKMFEKLENSELDLVIVKNANNDKNKLSSNIGYIKLGNLEDIFICNKALNFGKYNDLKVLDNKILYIPRNNSKALDKILEILKQEKINPIIKRVDSTTMVKLVQDSSNIGFITKEYINEELEQGKIKELKLNVNILKSEFGIYYIKDNRFKELTNLIRIIRHNFKL